jgi:hypothetical protein
MSVLAGLHHLKATFPAGVQKPDKRTSETCGESVRVRGVNGRSLEDSGSWDSLKGPAVCTMRTRRENVGAMGGGSGKRSLDHYHLGPFRVVTGTYILVGT